MAHRVNWYSHGIDVEQVKKHVNWHATSMGGQKRANTLDNDWMNECVMCAMPVPSRRIWKKYFKKYFYVKAEIVSADKGHYRYIHMQAFERNQGTHRK